MKKRILVEPLPAKGHFNPLFSLAKSLEDLYEFIFIGPVDYSNEASKFGFKFMVAETYFFTPVQSRLKQQGILTFLLENYINKQPGFVREITSVTKTYDVLINDIRPDLILVDDHLAPKSFYYSKFNVPIIIVLTTIPANKSNVVPPLQSTHIPSGKLFSIWRINYEWTKVSILRNFSSLMWKLLTKGKTNGAIYRSYLNHSDFELDSNTCFNPVIRNLSYISTVPRALEFAQVKYPGIQYCSIPRNNTSDQVISDDRLKGFLEKVVKARKVDSSIRLVYVSLGTLTDQFTKQCHRFFNEVIKLAKAHPDYHLILSVGHSIDIMQLDEKPNNVAIFGSVPQRSLLHHVDAMITHGGVNSVLDCIEATVPMLVYPLSREWDQPGISARVQHYGLGLSSSMRHAKAKSICNRLRAIFIDYEQFKMRLRAKQVEIEQESRTSLTKVKELIDRHIHLADAQRKR